MPFEKVGGVIWLVVLNDSGVNYPTHGHAGFSQFETERPSIWKLLIELSSKVFTR